MSSFPITRTCQQQKSFLERHKTFSKGRDSGRLSCKQGRVAERGGHPNCCIALHKDFWQLECPSSGKTCSCFLSYFLWSETTFSLAENTIHCSHSLNLLNDPRKSAQGNQRFLCLRWPCQRHLCGTKIWAVWPVIKKSCVWAGGGGEALLTEIRTIAACFTLLGF